MSNYCEEDYYNNISGNANSTHSSQTGTATTTGVDYSGDDFKYNYDDINYTETDYIATGDITNVKNHYNNNYPDYGCVSVEPRLIGDPEDDRAFSGGHGQGQHKHQQQQIDNISYSYCDSNRVPTTTTSGSQLSSVKYQPTINVSSGLVSSSGGTVVTTVTSKSGAMLIKQQPTVLYDEDEEDEYIDTYMAGENDEDEMDEEEYVEYMEDQVPINNATTTSAVCTTSGDYYTTPSTTLAKTGSATAPYYNYQVDSFNEEDEYKYLEEQKEQYHMQPDQFYREDPDDMSYNQRPQNGGGFPHHGVVDDMMNSSDHSMVPQPHQSTATNNVTKKKHLAAQDSIDDNEFFMKHSKNQLTINTTSPHALTTMQHDVIREEDECLSPIGSAGDYHHSSSVASPSVNALSPISTIKSVASPPPLSITAAPSLLLATTTATTSSSIIGGITASTAAAAMAAATTTMNHIADIGGGGAAAAEASTSSDIDLASNFKDLHHQQPMPMLLLDNGNSSVASLLDPSSITAPEKKKIGLGMAIGEMGMTVAGTSGMVGRKTEITAKQRWNWAYNKIIMQLNVSRFFLRNFPFNIYV